jgi:hypothetical protein
MHMLLRRRRYWALVYPSYTPEARANVDALASFQHGVNFLVMLADLLANGQPLPLLSGLRLYAYGLIYISWTGLFHGLRLAITSDGCVCVEGVDPGCVDRAVADQCFFIYRSLNWHHPASSLVLSALILFIAIPLIALAFWVLSRALGRCGRRDLGSAKRGFADKSWLGALRAEFSWQRLTAETGEAWIVDYGESPLLGDGALFAAWRVALTLFMLAIDLWFSIAHSSSGGFLLVYLTNWTCYLQFVCAYSRAPTYTVIVRSAAPRAAIIS